MMRTLVISDLHLGAANGTDLLRRAELRAPLVEALKGVDRLVILGDALELREMPVRAATAAAADLLGEAGAALGPEGEIVLAGGNHDHALVAPWIAARLQQAGPATLGLAHDIAPEEAGPLAVALAERARPARLRLAYPGLWLRDDVYAIHGHYSDLHTTVPTFERLAAGAMGRWVAPLPVADATPDDYEACLAPLYAWMHVLAERADEGVVKAGAGASARAWVALSGRSTRSPRALAVGLGYRGAIRAINRSGIGPVRPELSGAALRQGGLHGMGEALRRLGIRAPHVIWGHSHRAGPFPGDDECEWTAPTGSRLHNTGSWVYQRHFLPGGPNESPYWPGAAVLVEDEGAPRLMRLLGERGHAELAPAARG